MSKKGSGCGAIIGILILLAIIAAFSQIIGILIFGAIGAGVYFFINRAKFKEYPVPKQVGIIAGLIILFFVGAALGLPSSENTQEADINNPTQKVAEKETYKETPVSTSATRWLCSSSYIPTRC